MKHVVIWFIILRCEFFHNTHVLRQFDVITLPVHIGNEGIPSQQDSTVKDEAQNAPKVQLELIQGQKETRTSRLCSRHKKSSLKTPQLDRIDKYMSKSRIRSDTLKCSPKLPIVKFYSLAASTASVLPVTLCKISCVFLCNELTTFRSDKQSVFPTLCYLPIWTYFQ